METNTTPQELITSMIITAWDKQNESLYKLLDALPDEQLTMEIAPGRNTGIYLLGHLIAVSDGMLPLLGFGERLFPELQNIFIANPDKSGLKKPGIDELKASLNVVNEKLGQCIRSLSPAQWLERHTAISEEDFVKEPHRNKLNVIINRTNHMANHIGQMLLLKSGVA